MEKSISKIEARLEKNMADTKKDLETVNNDVAEMKISLVKCFEEMKDVLVEIKEENTRKVRNTPSGDRENIIVAGGFTKSVEMFNWRQNTWAPLQAMPNKRVGATSFLSNNHMVVVGGCTPNSLVDDVISMNAESIPDPSTSWSDYPIKLPTKLQHHSSVVYNHGLIVTGGYDVNMNATSDRIYDVQLNPPYTVKTSSRMPQSRQEHCTEIFEDMLLIIGGKRTDYCDNNLSSVVLYDIKKNEYKQLSPLPYEVSRMATVRWKDNIVVIGGCDKQGNVLDKVIIYNVETEQSHMLPPMKHKRYGCTAVVVGNNIVVLGGHGENGGEKSVKSFKFERYSWEELPEMAEERWFPTAVVV